MYEAPTWVAYGWTLINLFNFKRELYTGIWRLPLYQCPTNALIDTRDLWSLKLIPNTELCVRIANARTDLNVEIKDHDHADGEKPFEYDIPEIHAERDRYRPDDSDVEDEEDNLLGNNSNNDIKEKDDEANAEHGYEGHGLILKINRIMNYAPPSNTSIFVSLY